MRTVNELRDELLSVQRELTVLMQAEADGAEMQGDRQYVIERLTAKRDALKAELNSRLSFQ